MSGSLHTLSALAALVLSYVVGFAALAVLLLPYLGGWGIILSIGGVIIALPFLAAAALVLLVFRRSIAAHPLAWCCAAPPAVLAVWLAVEYGTNYRFRGFTILDYLAIRNVIERAVLVVLTACMVSVAFYVTEPRIRARVALALLRRRETRGNSRLALTIGPTRRPRN
ncbi:hypothetical protein [Methylorubrum populi]|uniref:Uncharacterized protein n=1 Tax=Methylorubrum populi TaxID=223967 RepID=A0A833J054_9HYPH|nr:hypothetical protein [Methylorubrum populi]KAB7782240.1 hypothetical protein F8B43_4995 [Methylorubrum populi]